MKQAIVALLFLLLGATGGLAQESTTWTDARGRTIQARFTGMDGDTVTLVTAAGKTIRIPIHHLNTASAGRAMELAERTVAPVEPADDKKGRKKKVRMRGHVMTLKIPGAELVIAADGDATLTYSVGDDFPLEYSPGVQLEENGQMRPVKLTGAYDEPRASEKEAVLFLEYGPTIKMEVHYETTGTEILAWYRFQTTESYETNHGLRLKFPPLVDWNGDEELYFGANHPKGISLEQLKKTVGRLSLVATGHSRADSKKFPYATPVNDRKAGALRSFSVPTNIFHDKEILATGPKAKEASLRFGIYRETAPFNGYRLSLHNDNPWSKSDRSTGFTIGFK